MSPYRRNVMVGATVMVALGVLVWMILQFGGDVMTPFAKPSVRIHLTSDRADGLAPGSAVYYRGVNSGKVVSVERNPNNIDVEIEAEVESTPPLPGNLEARIRQGAILGGSAGINLELLPDQAPSGQLQPNQRIPTAYVGLDVLPAEYGDLAIELRKTAQQFREANLPANLSAQITKVGNLVDSLQQYTNDPKLRDDFKTSVANFRDASDKATVIAANMQKFSESLPKMSADASAAISDAKTTVDQTQKHIDELNRSIGDRLGQLADILDHVNSIVTKVDKGDGTMGKLVNDPKLYQNLLETSDMLTTTASDLHRLLEQWEQEGVSLKLK